MGDGLGNLIHTAQLGSKAMGHHLAEIAHPSYSVRRLAEVAKLAIRIKVEGAGLGC